MAYHQRNGWQSCRARCRAVVKGMDMTHPTDKELEALVARLEDGRVCSPAQNSCRNGYLMLEAAAMLRALSAELTALKAELADARETNRRVHRRLQLLEGWWQRRVERARNERNMYLMLLCRDKPELRAIEEAAYQRGYQDGYDNKFVTPKKRVKARAFLARRQKETDT